LELKTPVFSTAEALQKKIFLHPGLENGGQKIT
jgi:hypothetical protein